MRKYVDPKWAQRAMQAHACLSGLGSLAGMVWFFTLRTSPWFQTGFDLIAVFSIANLLLAGVWVLVLGELLW